MPSFEVHSDAGDVVPVAGARLRDLVIRLALAGGKPVSTSALAEAVWGDDPPADLANALQTLVSRARRALGGAGAVEQSAAGYRLAVTSDDVDALRFERLVADGAVEEALGLWRGPALEDAGEFAAPYALRLHQLRLDATLTWLEREIAEGRAAAHVAEPSRQVIGIGLEAQRDEQLVVHRLLVDGLPEEVANREEHLPLGVREVHEGQRLADLHVEPRIQP